ncbi:MAG TPA: DUF6785 family protein, partial [Armatimonadota bacterium]|nr:DUF6785 family protein [Armatimonadota bacterium]
QIPTAPLLVLFALTRLLAPLLVRLFGPRAPARRDLLFAHALVLGTLTFGSAASLWYVPSIAAAPFYAEGGNAPWAKPVVSQLPEWMVLAQEPGQESAATYFYEGSPSGGADVPWRLWSPTIVGWGTMLLLFFFTMVCATGMFRRRWFRQEHISYPHAELALAVAGSASSWDSPGGIFRSRLLWLGFALPFAHSALLAAAFLFPGFPELSFKDRSLGAMFTDQPMSIIAGHLPFRFQWLVVGIAYVIPSQIAFGTVAFYFLGLVQMVLMAAMGATGGPWHPHTFRTNQTSGGIMVFASFIFWSARHDIRTMWRQLVAEIAGRRPEDAHPDRWLMVGAIAGTVGMVAWSRAAGLPLIVAAAFILVLVLWQLCISRIVAVLGMQHATMWIAPRQFLYSVVGTRAIGADLIPSLNMQERVLFGAEASTFVPMLLQGHKVADASGWRSGRYVPALIAAGAAAVLAYGYFVLRMAYQHGGVKLHPTWYFMYTEVHQYRGIFGEMSNLSGPSWPARLGILKGAATMWALMTAHRTLPWWPVHPLGYLMAAGYTSRVTWPGLLIGWSVKSMTNRFGGARSYFAVRPFFVGLLLGDVGGQAFWAVVCAVAAGLGYGSEA